MEMAIFKGSGVALVTPMKANEEIDLNRLEELIGFQIENGTDAILIGTTTGEGATLSGEEELSLIKAAKHFINGRAALIAGVGSNCTRNAICLAEEIEKIGVDGLLVNSPYYNVKTQTGVITHYTKIARAVKLPILMYNVPSRSNCNIEPETVAYLFNEEANIIGLKNATTDMEHTAKVMHLTEGEIDLYSGEDSIVVPMLELGGKGVISVWANIAPKKVHNMCQCFFEGDILTAKELQAEALPLISALFSDANPIPVKKALNLMGMEAGILRAPLYELGEEKTELLAQRMKNYGLL